MVAAPQAASAVERPACIFCAIVRKEAPAAWLAERDQAVAFLTRGPLRAGHALVIPRGHAATLDEVSASDWAAVGSLALDVARMQRDRLGAQGTTLFLASGEAGEQSVFHLHLHVVPRDLDDGVDLNSWWATRVQTVSEAELASVAARLRGRPERASE
jgi:histidine triad (HIT) family protein